MRWLTFILLWMLTSVAHPAFASDPSDADVDVAHMLFGHIGDSYGWHITDWNGRHVTIPLPCIVYSSTGWHVFMSSKIEHGHEHEGLFLAEEGRYADKIVEAGPDGNLVRPFDISITKNVASLMFGSALLVLLVLSCASWYRKHDASEETPGGFTGLMEMMIMMVRDDLIKDSVGPDYRRYAPYLLTAFFFIFLNIHNSFFNSYNNFFFYFSAHFSCNNCSCIIIYCF